MDIRNKKLVEKVLGNPEMFPPEFKRWIAGQLQQDPTITWDKSQIPNLPGSKIQQDAWTTYTPSWTASTTNPALGNGTLVGRYIRLGNLVIAHVDLTMGSTTTFGTGQYVFSLPVPQQAFQYPSAVRMLDSSAGAPYGGITSYVSASTVQVFNILTNTFITPTVPFTWATGDNLAFTQIYEA